MQEGLLRKLNEIMQKWYFFLSWSGKTHWMQRHIFFFIAKSFVRTVILLLFRRLIIMYFWCIPARWLPDSEFLPVTVDMAREKYEGKRLFSIRSGWSFVLSKKIHMLPPPRHSDALYNAVTFICIFALFSRKLKYLDKSLIFCTKVLSSLARESFTSRK